MLGAHPMVNRTAQQSTKRNLLNMKSMMKFYACIIACTSAFATFAKDNGCLIQGTLTGNGISQTSNYCAANKGMSDQDFKIGCQDLFEAQGGNSGGKKSDNSISMKFISECPANFKGACSGAFGHKLNLQYMDGDYALKQGQAKQVCEVSEGKWKQ